MRMFPAVLGVALLAVLGPVAPAAAQRGAVHRNASPPGEVLASWTADQRRAAVALPLPPLQQPVAFGAEALAPFPGDGHGEDGHPPTAGVAPDGGNRLYRPDPVTVPEVLQPFQAAPFGAYFTSSRLIPPSADRTYPYRAVGQLLFRKVDQGSLFACTASVIKRRVILTAAHCVHSGSSGPGYFRDFVFTPALRDGVAPFQSWEFELAVAPAAWRQGNGTLPHPTDYAVITLRDRMFNGNLKKIGNVVGFLGFQTLSLHPNHVHILGYPASFDGGQRLHQVTTTSVNFFGDNTVLFASDMTQGSSGGPFVQNFGKAATGQTVTGANRVVGVVSAGNSSQQSTVSSVPDSRLTAIVNTACNDQPGNC